MADADDPIAVAARWLADAVSDVVVAMSGRDRDGLAAHFRACLRAQQYDAARSGWHALGLIYPARTGRAPTWAGVSIRDGRVAGYIHPDDDKPRFTWPD